MEKRKSSINMVSQDAPMVSARLIYGSSTSNDGSATIHHGGARKAQDASTIRYGASKIQAGSARVASRPPMNMHDLVIVMRQSWGGGGGYSHHSLIFSSYIGSGPASTVHPKKYQVFQAPQKNLKF